MILLLALAAAMLCAVFNAAAAVLEKTGADNQAIVTATQTPARQKFHASLPYLSGIALDILAWLLTLYAVQVLPLFVVQPIIATSVVITLLIERHMTKRHLTSRHLLAVLTVLIGLAILAITAKPETIATLGRPIWWAIITAPIILAAVAGLIIALRPRRSAQLLAALSGLAFGGVSVAGRSLVITSHWLDTSYNPLAWAIAAYGLIGITLFTLALRQATATTVNATMVAFETVIPILVGFVFLGDHPAHGLWFVAALGIVATITGTLLISRIPARHTPQTT